MPTEYISPTTAVLKNGHEVEAELRVITGSDIDYDPDAGPEPAAQLGVFNYDTGQDLITVDLTTEALAQLRAAL